MKRSPLVQGGNAYRIEYFDERPHRPPAAGNPNMPVAGIDLSTHDLYSWHAPDGLWYPCHYTSVMAEFVAAQVLGLPSGTGELTSDQKRRYWHKLERLAGRQEKLR